MLSSYTNWEVLVHVFLLASLIVYGVQDKVVVSGLPVNLFPSAGVPTDLQQANLVLREEEAVFYDDASKESEPTLPLSTYSSEGVAELPVASSSTLSWRWVDQIPGISPSNESPSSPSSVPSSFLSLPIHLQTHIVSQLLHRDILSVQQTCRDLLSPQTTNGNYTNANPLCLPIHLPKPFPVQTFLACFYKTFLDSQISCIQYHVKHFTYTPFQWTQIAYTASLRSRGFKKSESLYYRLLEPYLSPIQQEYLHIFTQGVSPNAFEESPGNPFWRRHQMSLSVEMAGIIQKWSILMVENPGNLSVLSQAHQDLDNFILRHPDMYMYDFDGNLLRTCLILRNDFMLKRSLWLGINVLDGYGRHSLYEELFRPRGAISVKPEEELAELACLQLLCWNGVVQRTIVFNPIFWYPHVSTIQFFLRTQRHLALAFFLDYAKDDERGSALKAALGMGDITAVSLLLEKCSYSVRTLKKLYRRLMLRTPPLPGLSPPASINRMALLCAIRAQHGSFPWAYMMIKEFIANVTHSVWSWAFDRGQQYGPLSEY